MCVPDHWTFIILAEEEAMLKGFRFTGTFVILVLFILTGCSGIGPKTVARDRFDYIKAVSDSWEKQMLLNLVRLRYLHAPVFLDVASIINTYSLETELQAGASWNDFLAGDSQVLGARGRYTDRPTITYTPLMGEKFTESLMTPLPVSGILSLLQAGYPVDFVFRIGVQTINGIENRFGGKLMLRSTDPRFNRLIQAIGRIQSSNALGMRVKPKGETSAMVLFFRGKPSDEILMEMKNFRQLLGLNMDSREFRVVYGSIADGDKEIAIQTRSMLQIMVELASYIEVPEKDVVEGRVNANSEEADSGFPPLIRVRSGDSLPADAYVGVRYRKQWFWIDDRDLPSKRMFAFSMLLFSLTETGDRGGAPIVTVPTN
jgi:hypothetical protein